MNKTTLEKFRSILESQREAILALQDTREQSSNIVELDQTCTGRLTRMDAVQGQAMAKESSARAARQLKLIAAALGRLDQDEFGECLECGDDIAEARLEANPTTTLCVACAIAKEQQSRG